MIAKAKGLRIGALPSSSPSQVPTPPATSQTVPLKTDDPLIQEIKAQPSQGAEKIFRQRHPSYKKDIPLEKEMEQAKINFAEARRKAAEAGVSLQPARIQVDRNTKPLDLLLQYLAPYLPFFPKNPAAKGCRMGLTDVAPLIGIKKSSNTMAYRYFDGTRPLPIELFVRLINALEIVDPSWLLYLLYRPHLDRYFDVTAIDLNGSKRVVLVLKQGGYPSKFPAYDTLVKGGVGRLIFGARVHEGLSLKDLAEKMRKHPEAETKDLTIQPVRLRGYEENRVSFDQGSSLSLDIFIETLDLNPSLAYLANRPWLSLFIPTFYPPTEPQSNAVLVTRLAPPPFPSQFATSEAKLRPRFIQMSGATGFGAFIRRARLLSGLEGGEAERLCEITSTGLNDYELHGVQLPMKTLRLMAAHYREGILETAAYSQDPLSELMIRHNREHYPKVKLKLYQKNPILLTSDWDARVASRLLSLPETHFKRRVFILRTSQGLSKDAMAESLGITDGVISNAEDPDNQSIPSLYFLRKLSGDDPNRLRVWRFCVRETFYPSISWDFLEAERLYLSDHADVNRLATLVTKGPLDSYGMRRLKSTHTFDSSDLRSTEEAKLPTSPFPHIQRSYEQRVPQEGRRRILEAGSSFTIYELAYTSENSPSEIMTSTISLVRDLLPFRPRLILRLPYVDPAIMERLSHAMRGILSSLSAIATHVILITESCLVSLQNKAGSITGDTVSSEDYKDRPLFIEEEVRVFLTLGNSSTSPVSPYPTARELLAQAEKTDGISQKQLPKLLETDAVTIRTLVNQERPIKNTDLALLDALRSRLPSLNFHLFAAQIIPGFVKRFPEVISVGYIRIEGFMALIRAFEADFPNILEKPSDEAVAAWAQVYGLEEKYLWLRLNPLAVVLFPFRETNWDRPISLKHLPPAEIIARLANYSEKFNPFVNPEINKEE